MCTTANISPAIADAVPWRSRWRLYDSRTTPESIAPKSPTRISSRTSEPSCEQQDGSGIEEGSCRRDSSLEVLGQTTASSKPGQEAFDHPASGMHGKTNLPGLFSDDLDDDPGRIRHAFGGIGAIGEGPLDEGIQRAGRPQQRDGAVPILHRGRLDLKHQPAAIGIDHGLTLAPVDFLARVIAARTTGLGGLDALAVDDRRTGAGLAADTHSVQHHQLVV